MFLITGFEPFISAEGVTLDENPTAAIAQAVAATSGDIESRIFPVSYERTRMAFELALREVKPKFWVGLGYAPHRSTIDVESIALNLEYSTRPDNDGIQPNGRPIITGSPLARQTNVDVKQAVTFLDGCGAPARRWTHAGTFLCNQVFFLGCEAVAAGGPPSYSIFVHVPPMESYAPLIVGLSQWLSSMRTKLSFVCPIEGTTE